MNIHPMRNQFFHAEGQIERQMDITKQQVAFRNSDNALANRLHIYRRPADALAFLQAEALISLYCQFKQLYTPSIS
jgi:hypothetical protein